MAGFSFSQNWTPDQKEGQKKGQKEGQKDPYPTLASFYPFYLSQHAHPTNRLLHFYGTTLVLLGLLATLLSGQTRILWALPVLGYVPAWIGHFTFEKNRPATFRYPFKSLVCDFKMYADIWRGRR